MCQVTQFYGSLYVACDPTYWASKIEKYKLQNQVTRERTILHYYCSCVQVLTCDREYEILKFFLIYPVFYM